MDKELKYHSVRVLKYFLFVPFVIGVIMNFDGMRIMFGYKSYNMGLLEVDSLFGGQGPQDRNATYYAIGSVDSVRTTVIVGAAGSPHTDSIMRQASNGSAFIPVWFRANGILTIERNSYEQEFPLVRVMRKVLLLFLLLNMPFILFHLMETKIKRKIKAMTMRGSRL